MDSIADAVLEAAATTPRFEDGFANVRKLPLQLAEGIANVAMGARAGQLCETTASRRNGYREHRIAICVGTLAHRVPKLRTGELFPGRRARAIPVGRPRGRGGIVRDRHKHAQGA
ncbi:hypothetical protein Shel_03440 [Slackia heliotrinireducens DSM 20476]|uniref:Uncharacterized protein n=1 Tax=Slackia heliotrinireducens (strain ATCC 29202 / DSM 20476 / NCTC 11029 / RHS 1) TaxID=471855 RepID=C7N2A3_SLAHD|nr:hypothetical protein Shel_03440 [Slackia heliotrinireducens DSM 20476]